MKSPITISVAHQLAELESFITGEFAAGTPDSCFAIHVYEAASEAGPVGSWEPFPSIDDLHQGHGPALAAMGYRIGSDASNCSTGLMSDWENGINRLIGRDAFPADKITCAFRPIELYGIARGLVKSLGADHAARNWLRETLSRLEREANSDPFGDLLYAASARLIGQPWTNRKPRISDGSGADHALQRWLLVSHSPVSIEDKTRIKALDSKLLEIALLRRIVPESTAKAALFHHAIRRAASERLESDLEATWLVNRERQAATEIIVSLCRRFALFARQIQDRRTGRAIFTFKDEYDVQDAMHALLKLYFDDVRAEETTPSYAGNSSRIDFLLKKERVVIEVKMTRHNLKQKEIVNQLIEDKERYRTHPDYDTLICFVYDPDGYCDNPAAIETDVAESEGDYRVTTVVAPKGM